MGRIENSRIGHVAQWVLPSASRILIEAACQDASFVSLSEIAHIEMGQSPSSESCNDTGAGMPLIGGPADLGLRRPASSRWTTNPTKTCKRGDIIVCIRATIGEPRWADGVYCLGRGVAGIHPLRDDLLPQFLFWIIDGQTESLKSQGTGTTFKTISKINLEKIKIPLISTIEQKKIGDFLAWLEGYTSGRPDFNIAPELPKRFNLQRRLIEWIEELGAQINEARTLRQKAVREVEALISASSERCFQPKEGWKTMAVGEFCEPPQYGYTETAIGDPIGPRFLRITDIQGGRVDWKQVPFCRCPDPEKYLLKPGDLVFARTGATTGKSFVIQECPEAVFASYLIRLRVHNSVSVDYLYHYFQSPSYWIQIADEKKGTGQPNLNGAKLEKLKVPIAPGPEQRRIVAELDAMQAEVDALKRLQAETTAELDALLPSILDRAFKGNL